MNKVKISNTINVITGGRRELLCYRVYIHARLRGGLWLGMEKTIDVTFYLIRGEREHVRRNYLWQRREHAKTRNSKKETKQMSEDWEQSFLPFGEGGIPPDEVQCDNCSKLGSLTLDMIEVRKYTNSEPINLRFCNETCHQEFYLTQLRKGEGHETCSRCRNGGMFDW